jgi:hypothetical protein
LCKLTTLEGFKKAVVKGGPSRMTRSVWKEVEGLRMWIGNEILVIEVETEVA